MLVLVNKVSEVLIIAPVVPWSFESFEMRTHETDAAWFKAGVFPSIAPHNMDISNYCWWLQPTDMLQAQNMTLSL